MRANLVIILQLLTVSLRSVVGLTCFECHGTSVSDVTSSCWETVNSEHARFVSLVDCAGGSCSTIVLNHTSIGLHDYTRTCDYNCKDDCYETPFGTKLCKYCCKSDRCNGILPMTKHIPYQNDTTASNGNLEKWMRELFSKVRHHSAGPSIKFHMRHEITKLMKSFSPKVERQEVEVSEVHAEDRAPDNFRSFIRTTTRGFNIIATYPGQNFKTTNDVITVVMAHYDTAPETPGVNDNGSGVSALLELARLYKMSNCERQNTVIFVATDFKEHGIYRETGEDPSSCIPDRSYVHNVGSTNFVCKWLLPHLQQYGGTLGIALNLDGILNVFTGEKSYKWPREFQRPIRSYRPYGLSFYQAALSKSFSSDWWMVKSSTSAFQKIFSANVTSTPNLRESDFLYLQLDPRSDDARSPGMLEMLHKDDCAPFHEVTSMELPCATISDTAKLRGYMTRCHHTECDDTDHIDSARMDNLAKLVNILHHFLSTLSVPRCVEDNETDIAVEEFVPQCNTPLIRKRTSVFISATCSRSGTIFEMCPSLSDGIWATLKGDSAWIPRKSKLGKAPLWFQVDFGEVVNVTAIAIQGVRRKGYVRSYMVSHSNNERDWEWYIPAQAQFDDASRRAEFRGCNNGRDIEKQDIKPSILARFIRIYPRWWRKRIAMRAQVYGCYLATD